jgi:DNA primase
MDNKILKELANARILDILDDLGVEYRERYNYVVAQCPIHVGQRRDAFSFHLDMGLWRCFSRGCHETYGKDIIGLIRGVLSISYPDALRYLGQFVSNQDLDDKEIKELYDLRDNKFFVRNHKRKKKNVRVYPEEILSRLEYHDYLESRGFAKDIVEKYQIGVCLEYGKYFYNRVVFPIRNAQGQIIGFSGRTLDDDWKVKCIPKWKFSKDFIPDLSLFNIENAKAWINDNGIENGSIILTEGPLDCLKLVQSGIYNCVATLGKTLHNGQMSILMTIGVNRILFAYDNDAAGQTGAAKTEKLAGSFFNTKIIKLPEEINDIGEMKEDDVRELFKI